MHIRDEVGVLLTAFELGGLGASTVALGGAAITCPALLCDGSHVFPAAGRSCVFS